MVDAPILEAGPAAVARGRVLHHRNEPVEHRFETDLHQIWIDPDRPEELFDRHRAWSTRRPAPVRFRRRDYLDGSNRPIGDEVRNALAPVLGDPPSGPLRMLTQARTWGWLFNPITVYLAWDTDPSPGEGPPGTGTGDPVAVLLEVTNTPWKERHLYPLALERDDRATAPTLTAQFAKRLHVSPFIDEDQVYVLRIRGTASSRMIHMSLDVHPCPPGAPVPDGVPDRPPILSTGVHARLLPPTAASLRAPLRPDRLPTHRVSAGIHRQAASLWRKGVPFVPHPRKAS